LAIGYVELVGAAVLMGKVTGIAVDGKTEVELPPPPGFF